MARALERQPLEWIDEAPVRVSVSRRMAVGADAVFVVIADHETWPEWFDGVEEVRVTGAAEGVGGQRQVVVRGLGVFDEEFLAWEPGRRFGFAVTHMTRPVFRTLNELVTLEPDGDATVVTYTQGYAPAPWAWPLLWPVARWRLPKVLAGALAALEEQARAPRH